MMKYSREGVYVFAPTSKMIAYDVVKAACKCGLIDDICYFKISRTLHGGNFERGNTIVIKDGGIIMMQRIDLSLKISEDAVLVDCEEFIINIYDNLVVPHPHCEGMKLYAEDAMKTSEPWTLWEYRNPTGKSYSWMPCERNPGWVPTHEYRRKVDYENVANELKEEREKNEQLRNRIDKLESELIDLKALTRV